jgi:cytochrome c biogenesis protein CcmG/thiol:disulfide interchange protein DsbE
MKRPTRLAAVGVGACVLVLAVVLALQVDNDPSFASGRLLGRPAPVFAGPDLAGGTIDSRDLAGKVVFVNFWNDWCIPCRQEAPALQAFWEAHRDEPDFAMVGIVRDVRSERDLRDYAFEEGVAWPVMFDPGGRAAVDFATTGQPESFMIDARGVVVGFQSGPASLDDLEAMLAAARGEIEP